MRNNRIDSEGIPTKHTNHTKLNSSDGSWLGDSHLSVLELNDPTHGVIGFFRAFRVFRGLLGLHGYDWALPAVPWARQSVD